VSKRYTRNTKGTKKYTQNIADAWVKNILYFFELEVLGKHDRKNIDKHWKGPIFLEKQQCAPKKNIMDTININILVGEN
jgi:hypothetical protein